MKQRITPLCFMQSVFHYITIFLSSSLICFLYILPNFNIFFSSSHVGCSSTSTALLAHASPQGNTISIFISETRKGKFPQFTLEYRLQALVLSNFMLVLSYTNLLPIFVKPFSESMTWIYQEILKAFITKSFVALACDIFQDLWATKLAAQECNTATMGIT